MSKKIKKQLAREFRKNPTKSEKLMWKALRNRKFLNLKFRRQHLFEGYILDFYCTKLKLAIEINGAIHFNQVEKDKKRQQALENSEIIFYRIKSEHIECNINEVIEELTNFIQNIS